MEIGIGTGGWQYFPLATVDKLRGYTKVFDFVEVNSTYYSSIPLAAVTGWEEAVPPESEFSVKFTREVNAALCSEDISQLLSQMESMARICEMLDASMLVVQTPKRLNMSRVAHQAVMKMTSLARERTLRLAWRTRCLPSSSTLAFLQSNGVIQVTDLTRRSPDCFDDVLYSKLFGRERHTMCRFSEGNYRNIEERVTSCNPKKAYLAFHGVGMHADALKFKLLIGTRDRSN